MDRLTLHIEYLLQHHDCVTVPGVGAFLNVYESALTDASTGMIRPMRREVRFNGALRHDDGLLASSYARKERIPFADGRELLRKSVGELTALLHAERQVPVGRLGMLESDEDDRVSFRPFSTADAIASRLGFLPVSILCEASKEDPVYVLPPETEESGTVADSESEKRNTRKRKFDTERNYYIAVNKMFARMAAAFVVVAVIGLSVIMPFTRPSLTDQASVVPVKTITEAVTGNHEGENGKAVIGEEPASVEETYAAVSDVDAADSWHIIVGTFRTQDEADMFISCNADRGYDLRIVNSGRLYRVAAYSSSDKDSALDVLRSSDFKANFPQAWIYESH